MPKAPIVVKLGGATLEDAEAMAACLPALARLAAENPLVIIHGAGPQATRLARRLGHEPRISHGRRITTDLDLDILAYTARGKLNGWLSAQLSARGLKAVGVSGADAGLVRVTRRPPWTVDGETIDFGWVGDVERVDPSLLQTLLEGGFTPIVAPLCADAEGQLFNVNADTIALNLAQTLDAASLLLVTEAGSVWRDPADPTSRLARCDAATFEEGKREGWIRGGMRVKLDIAFAALRGGVNDVAILAPDDLLQRDHATRIVPDA